jgi:AcrR family transcriptional regulator
VPKIVDHDQRRQEYLDAVWRVVARDGAGAVSVRSVAKEAEVSKTNLTYYFPTRVELLAAAADRLLDEAERKLGAFDLTQVDFDSATQAVLISIPTSTARRRQSEIWLLLVAERREDPQIHKILARLNGRVRDALVSGLELLGEAGLVHPGRDVELEAARLHALIDGLSLQTINDQRLMPRATIEAVVRGHLQDLANAPH